ncbi:unnamed protein product [Trifolium pratense]|uniref:Uncharacterized protein n=1 Tax=Trifolium pratense TaxID=57577 RepID=A0ACB0J0H4_TRIPR|nr:unnamed protein product [Trifolium pratense]
MEKGLVSYAFDDIDDLVPGKERVRIKARIVRLWKVPAFLNPNESGSIELRWFLSKVVWLAGLNQKAARMYWGSFTVALRTIEKELLHLDLCLFFHKIGNDVSGFMGDIYTLDT